MANLFEHKDRWLIPNWRSFNKTTMLGELDSFQMSSNIVTETTIEDYISDWQSNNCVVNAADLLSAAFVNNKKTNTQVSKAANFILSNKTIATKSQISLACEILKKSSDKDLSDSFKNVTFDNLPLSIKFEPIRAKIKQVKQIINNFPANPILYVELSRYYSILGQENQSINAMRIALHLANDNRFVLRCAARLFAHYHSEFNDHLTYIHNILRKSPITSIDPWLTSAEISIANLRNRSSKFVKKGIELVNSKNISPANFSELASSIATVELMYGGNKKSREFFKKALICPNDNTLAQLEWASTKDTRLDFPVSDFDVKMNFEALALDNYHSNNFESAIENAAKWFIDMPFSKRPIMLGSNIASIILKDQAKAISFINAGLLSNPNDPQLINNLAYSLALDNRPKEAFENINKIRNNTDIDEITQICLNATSGLAYFRDGLFDEGRQKYIDAIDKTNRIGHKELNWIALLNYAREEILIKSDYVKSIMQTISKIPKEYNDIEIQVLRNDVLDLYKLTYN